MNYNINLFLEEQHTTEIVIGPHLLSNFEQIGAFQCAIVCDSLLQKKVITNIVQPLQKIGRSPIFIPISAGEGAKTFDTYEMVIKTLINHECSGDMHLIACGGGTVLDLAGFVASTYCRGIPLYLMPTTLLSMVDGAIGGKNGINVRGIKNIVGTSYQPKKVIIDPDFLQTLSKYDMACGLAEMIKHALITGYEAFSFLEKNLEAVLNKNSEVVERAMRESIGIKCAVVHASSTNPNKRHLLNFGHTVAHAIEALEQFQISHGHAVAIGLVVESFLAKSLGLLSEHDFEHILKVVGMLGFSLTLSEQYGYDEWEKVFTLDKKTREARPRFVLMQGIGKYLVKDGDYCHEVLDDRLYEMIDWIQRKEV